MQKYLYGALSFLFFNMMTFAQSAEYLTSSVAPETEIKSYPLNTMQLLRTEKKPAQAILLGENYLKTHPQDNDIRLLVGLSFFQLGTLEPQHQAQYFKEAKQYLYTVLQKAPHYLDAKFGLINIAIAEGNHQEADRLLTQVRQQAPHDERIAHHRSKVSEAHFDARLDQLKKYYNQQKFDATIQLATRILSQHPDNDAVRLTLGHAYQAKKAYPQAESIYRTLLKRSVFQKQAYLGLIQIEIAQGHDRLASYRLQEALYLFPNDPDLLAERVRVFSMQHMHAKGAELTKEILQDHPKHALARAEFAEIYQLNPHLTYGLNEVSANTEVDWISDLEQYWEYTNSNYNRDTDWGSYTLMLNNAMRFGVNANQGGFVVTPVINKDFFVKLGSAYAHEPILFPTYAGSAEGYFTGAPLELSAGFTYAYIKPQTAYVLYTGSISKEWGPYWFTFRPNFFRPQSGNKNSILYTGSIIRYLGPKDTYLRLMFGSGTSPDLANLTTTDFIRIKNTYAAYTIQFPVINHQFLMTLGGDVQHWQFLNLNRIRNITGVIVGINYRFEQPK